MSTLTQYFPTLADLAARLGPGDKVISDLIELLGQNNEMLEDMVWLPANGVTTHKTTVRTGLPAATWRKLNYGVQPSKSQVAPVTDTMGMLEAYAEVDKSLVSLNDNAAAFRLSEDMAFIEAMNQNVQQTLFYGDASTPEQFVGLAPRFATKSGAANGSNIILADSGASGSDQSSIWIVGWGPNTVHGIYPKGSKAGLAVQDLGEQTLFDAAGGRYQGFRTHYKWDCGLTVRDWRFVVRIANIDTSALVKDAATGADIIDAIVQGLEILPSLGNVRPVIYTNRTIRSWMRRQITNTKYMNLTFDTVTGKRVLAVDGVPVRRVDRLLNTEAVVA